jgi:SAM-dependent methyltransferase
MTSINRGYYEHAYKSTGRIIAYWRKRLSFDQRYKCSVNWELLRMWLRERDGVNQVLEVGFGLGLSLLKFPREVTLCGVEISHNAARNILQQCNRENRNILLCVNDLVGALPFNTRFDVIICSHVLEHVFDDAALLSEFRRLLSQNGVLLLNVPINEQINDPKHLRKYDEQIIKQRLAMAGFRIDRQAEADHWGAFFSGSSETNLTRKALRAVLALLPYHLVEWIGQTCLHSTPNTQLAVLAVPNKY